MRAVVPTVTVVLVALSAGVAFASTLDEAALAEVASAAARDYFEKLEELMEDARAQDKRPPLWERVRGDLDAVVLSSTCSDTGWSADVLVSQPISRAPYLSAYASDLVYADFVVVSLASRGRTVLNPVEPEFLTPGVVESLNDTTSATLEMSNTAEGRVTLAVAAFRRSDSIKRLICGLPEANWPETRLETLLHQGDSSQSRFYVVRIMEDPDRPDNRRSVIGLVHVAFPKWISVSPVRLVPRDPSSVVGSLGRRSPN